MANLKDIRKRINSVKNTQKITSAMKLVSAAYFAKAVKALQQARPFQEAFSGMVANILANSDGRLESPLLRRAKESRALLVMVGSDRGLCGALNANSNKNAKFFLEDKQSEGVKIDLYPWGRKPTAFAHKLANKSVGSLERVLNKPQYDDAKRLAVELMDKFINGGYDRVYLAYPRFKSAMDQIPTIQQLLPIEPRFAEEEFGKIDYILEPGLGDMLDMLLQRCIFQQVFQVLLEGAASEHGARMTAMDSATNNANEVTKKLTIQYNKARQAAITTELTEIIGGTEALK